MGDVKREQEKRTTRILDKSKIGVAPNCAGGLVGSKQIVSRKHILANKSLQSSGRSNDLNKYSHSHGHGSRVGIKPNPASSAVLQSANHPSVSSASQNVSAVSAGPSQSQQNQQHSQQASMPNHMPGMPTGMPMGVSSASNTHGLSSHTLNGCHPMLDRNKHKNKPNNPEIMKRTLRYEAKVYLFILRRPQNLKNRFDSSTFSNANKNGRIFQNFVAFSEYLNFNCGHFSWFFTHSLIDFKSLPSTQIKSGYGNQVKRHVM